MLRIGHACLESRARGLRDERLHTLHTGAIPAGQICLLTCMDSALWAPPTSQTTKSYVLRPKQEQASHVTNILVFRLPRLSFLRQSPHVCLHGYTACMQCIHACLHSRCRNTVQKDGHLPWALASAACWSASPTCRVRRGSWAFSPK